MAISAAGSEERVAKAAGVGTAELAVVERLLILKQLYQEKRGGARQLRTEVQVRAGTSDEAFGRGKEKKQGLVSCIVV